VPIGRLSQYVRAGAQYAADDGPNVATDDEPAAVIEANDKSAPDDGPATVVDANDGPASDVDADDEPAEPVRQWSL
jgi:hypothetical protein